MYESKISTRKWIILDLIGNAGWIMFYAAMIHVFAAHRTILDNRLVFAMVIIDLLSSAGILVGIVELISERFQKLDYILPKIRLYRGFGMLMVSGFIAAVATLIARLLVFNADCLSYALVGSLLCGFASYALFKEYKPQK